MDYLAIGICYEYEGFCGSRDVPGDNPQQVADFMAVEFDMDMDEILLVAVQDGFPTVIHSWRAGEHYNRSGAEAAQ